MKHKIMLTAIGVIVAIAYFVMCYALVIAPAAGKITFCHTDTECGCIDDCLEPQPKE